MAIFGPQNSGQLSKADADRKRELAKQLMGSNFRAVNPLGALAMGLEGTVSGLYDKDASGAEKAGNAQVAELLAGKDYTGAMGNEWASPQQAALAATLQGRDWQLSDRSAQWAREDQRAAQARAEAAAAASAPDFKTIELGGDVYRYDANDPNSQPSMFIDGPNAGPSLPTSYQEYQLAQADPAYAASLSSSTTKPPTEGERRNQQLATVIEPELANVEKNWKALTDAGNQMTGADLGGNRPGLALTSPEYQQALSSLSTIVASYLYSVSGATATDEEIKRQVDLLTPKLGESEASVNDKLARIKTYAEAVKGAAGRAADAPGAADPDVDMILQKYGY